MRRSNPVPQWSASSPQFAAGSRASRRRPLAQQSSAAADSAPARPPAALDGLAGYSLCVAALLLPLAISWTTADPVVLPKMLVARALVLLLALLMAARTLRTRSIEIRRTPLDLPLAALMLSAGLSTALAENRALSIFGAYGRDEGLLTAVTDVALFWLGAQFLHNAGEARRLLRWLLAGGYIVAMLGIAQTLLGSALGVPRQETAFTFAGTVRAASSLGNPNALGALMAMLLPPALWELGQARTATDRLLALNCAITFLCALILTFSRSAWLGAAMGAGVLASGMLARSATRRQGQATVAALAIAIVAIVAITLLPSTGQVAARLASLADPGSGSAATRLHIWHDSLSLIAHRPLTGYGPDSFGLVYPRFQTGDWTGGPLIDKAHSDLVQLAATQDRKSTRLNSSHLGISYAVFCLKKKKKTSKADYYQKKSKKRKNIYI